MFVAPRRAGADRPQDFASYPAPRTAIFIVVEFAHLRL
jgi:hypothetical protein